MLLLWEAIGIIEPHCKLYFVATTSNGAFPNWKTYRLHNLLDGNPNSDISYRSVSLFALHRCIFFFSDAPHLIKTTRNCLYHSAYGGSRCTWNENKHLLWGHIVKMWNEGLDNRLKVLPKLTYDHIALTPFSTTFVRYATQGLSNKWPPF